MFVVILKQDNDPERYVNNNNSSGYVFWTPIACWTWWCRSVGFISFNPHPMRQVLWFLRVSSGLQFLHLNSGGNVVKYCIGTLGIKWVKICKRSGQVLAQSRHYVNVLSLWTPCTQGNWDLEKWMTCSRPHSGEVAHRGLKPWDPIACSFSPPP